MDTHDFADLRESYDVFERISHGTFSVVYRATPKMCPGRSVALKRLHMISKPERMLLEVEILSKVGGQKHIVSLLGGIRDKETYRTTLVLNYFPHDSFSSFYRKMDVPHLQTYLFQLLEALDHLHTNGFIHRDIKPSNFLHDYANASSQLVDFGLAQRMDIVPKRGKAEREPIHPTQRIKQFALHNSMAQKRKLPHVPRAGTRGFRPPEVLLRSSAQTGAVDIWAVGVILLSVIGGIYPLFKPEDDLDGLLELAELKGTRSLKHAAAACDRSVSLPPFKERTWKEVCEYLKAKSSDRREWPDELFGLLEQLLCLEPYKRISAADALKHPFFQL